MIKLKAGALEAALSPDMGGALLWLTSGGIDLLQRAPGDGHDPLLTASFPLVPYANRIAHGRFTFDGQSHKLPRNFGDHPHSIHGNGWQSKWAAQDVASDSVNLALDHMADAAWPWDYGAQQHVLLTPDALTLRLTVTNRSDRAMPVGLGFHPYFLADADTRLTFDAASLWLSTPDMLPDREVAADTLGDWSRGGVVPGDSLIDNVYGGWTGSALIQRGGGTRLTLTAQGADWLHVYRPPNATHFCVEPVTHMPDALNLSEGMESLLPGAHRSLSMTIAIGKSDETLPNGDELS
ncbi:aldose 1-epimerase [Sphingobium sp.]|uniref:aldose 1-epimerase n=1 Tax=Sphingobium sp. TaxID=1912891 RepID=UPI003BB79BA2